MSKATAETATLDSPQATAKVTADIVTVTPAMARRWLGYNDGNRGLKHVRIDSYVRDIDAGRFLFTGESIKFDWNGRLIDGQNRLTAVIRADKAIRTLVVRGLDPFVQRILDTGSKRSAGDALKMSGHHANPHVLAAAIRLLSAWESGALKTSASTAPELTHSEVLSFHSRNSELLDYSAKLAQRWHREFETTPSPLAATIFITSQIDMEAAFTFFSGMFEMDLDGKSDPRSVLLRRLRSLREEKPIPAQVVYFVLRAWNAWRDQQPIAGMKDRVRGTAARIPEPK